MFAKWNRIGEDGGGVKAGDHRTEADDFNDIEIVNNSRKYETKFRTGAAWIVTEREWTDRACYSLPRLRSQCPCEQVQIKGTGSSLHNLK